MADEELHDEIVEWMDSLDDDEWDRAVVVIDRLVALGSMARMPLSRSLGDGLFELRFTTFRKERNNERADIVRAREAAETCARTYS